MEIPYSQQNPKSIRLLFTRIARNYDLTNHVISLGLDVHWRKKFLRSLEGRQRIADICCGSGAMFPLLGKRIATGLDFTHAMLQVSRTRDGSIPLVEGDAQNMPLVGGSFDAAIMV